MPQPSGGAGLPVRSAELSQLPLLKEDHLHDLAAMPKGTTRYVPACLTIPVQVSPFVAGLVDVNNQQLDLRTRHSWLLKLEEIETPELAEVRQTQRPLELVLFSNRCLRRRSSPLIPWRLLL
jgi:hypothetical protein